MESGMDDGVRFTAAKSVSNKTTGVHSFDFHSIDLNAYLYKEKRTLATMAAVLGNASGVRHWTAQADTLRPRLQQYFYNPDPGGGSGWFQDKHCLGPLGAVKRP
jgi:putative isomerase